MLRLATLSTSCVPIGFRVNGEVSFFCSHVSMRSRS